MLELNSDNFEKETRAGVVLVDFWAEWCGPCKQLAPVFEKVSDAYDNVKFAKVDAQENRELAVENGVMGIPCLVFFNDGEEVGRVVGALSEDKLKAEIDKVLEKV